ncbi:protoglobin [Chthoniobacter flavus]|uniref:protoglobin domain-containing protein n=1 Tax=Chthoniobacter flavus TaxID=191863 RepID=UPI0010E5FB08|nr:protoglobin domain-containing protein [Chthoniobacter flavus]TCO95499.1 protoglobin [Chthoniobacter flavus]
MKQRTAADIPGYDYGTHRVAVSPVSMEEFAQLKATADFTEEDERYLKMAGEVLSDQAEAMVNVWRERIGAQEYLARVFFGPDGKPDDRYKAAVKRRFVQWVVDLCTRPFDQAWLDYQEEIALRHLPEKKKPDRSCGNTARGSAALSRGIRGAGRNYDPGFPRQARPFRRANRENAPRVDQGGPAHCRPLDSALLQRRGVVSAARGTVVSWP